MTWSGTATKDSLPSQSVHTWLQLEQDVGKGLRQLEKEFLELNVADPREHTQLQILELLTFREQAAGLEKDLTDLLTDLDFPQTNNVGKGLKGPRTRTAVLGCKKGTSCTGSCHRDPAEVVTPKWGDITSRTLQRRSSRTHLRARSPR